jgi:molecular chaperone GrpE
MRKQKDPADEPNQNTTPEPGDEPTETATPTDKKVRAEMKALTEKVQSLADENAQLKDQLMRTMADLQNFRKRSALDRIALQQFAAEQLVLELLPVLDNFERTLAAVDSGASPEAVIEGVRATDRQLRNALEAKNLTRIESEGTQFDPDLHHALATFETDEVEEGTVTHEIEAGYRLADKVIRPAKVRVAKKPSARSCLGPTGSEELPT